MKASTFLYLVATVLLSLLFLTVGLFWTMDLRSPLHLASQSLEMPRTARFVPRDAALTLHWLVNPANLPSYLQSVAPAKDRRKARDAGFELREGAFALAGLDYSSELQSWIGSELSFTLLDAGEGPGWVLALTSREEDGARRFLQRFWQTRSLVGTDLQVTSYRGIGLISGRASLIGQKPFPLATALIDNDLLLIASGRGVLERSLDVSQLQYQHQYGDSLLKEQIRDLGKGVAILTASPKALENWFQLPEDFSSRSDLSGLVVALRPKGQELVVDGFLRFKDLLDSTPWNSGEDLIRTAGGNTRVLVQLQNPARLINTEDSHPFSKWFGPSLRTWLQSQQAMEEIIGNDDGPLLIQNFTDGLLLTSRKGHPALDLVDKKLLNSGLSRSQLDEEGLNLQVWTRLVRKPGRVEELQAKLAVVNEQNDEFNWWGETLATLNHRHEGKALLMQLKQLQGLTNNTISSHSLLLASDPARKLLADWQPWLKLQTLGGFSFESRVQSLSIAVEADREDKGISVLPLHVNLQFS